MNKTVIANWGHSNQGKSTVVKLLAQALLKKYPNAITDPVKVDFSVDIKCVITIGKIKVGFESQGDPNSRLFESIKDFATLECDIIVCSTRTSGRTVTAVNQIHDRHGYDIIWVTNHRSNEKDRDQLNTLSATQLLALLSKLIDGNL